jgi:hypothetical protein
MSRRILFVLITHIALIALAVGQGASTSNPQALSYAAQSMAALTGGATISDVTLTGNVTWNISLADSGTATLRALGTAESRTDFALSSGTRTEIRDAQTGIQIGLWLNPDGSSGPISFQNCQTDAAWFFPVLGSLAAGANVVLSYVGEETRNGELVQHIQSSIIEPTASVAPLSQFSTMNFYLDASSLLPVAMTLNAHPDNNNITALPVEIDFSNYQSIGGALVPMHIQRFLQGALQVDLSISNVSFNTGLPLSVFTVN